MEENLAFLAKLHMNLPLDPAIPFPGIYITDSDAKIQKYVLSCLILERDYK